LPIIPSVMNDKHCGNWQHFRTMFIHNSMAKQESQKGRDFVTTNWFPPNNPYNWWPAWIFVKRKSNVWRANRLVKKKFG